MLFWHSMSMTQQLMPIYNTTVHKNKTFALNMAKYVSATRLQHAIMAGHAYVLCEFMAKWGRQWQTMMIISRVENLMNMGEMKFSTGVIYICYTGLE